MSRGNLLPFSLDIRPTAEEAKEAFSRLRIPIEAWDLLIDIAHAHPHGLTTTEVAVLRANAPEDEKLVNVVEAVHYKVMTYGGQAPSPGFELGKIARNWHGPTGCATRRHPPPAMHAVGDAAATTLIFLTVRPV